MRHVMMISALVGLSLGAACAPSGEGGEEEWNTCAMSFGATADDDGCPGAWGCKAVEGPEEGVSGEGGTEGAAPAEEARSGASKMRAAVEAMKAQRAAETADADGDHTGGNPPGWKPWTARKGPATE